MLIGRERESAAIERLVTEAAAGRSGSLVLRGVPGVGKTALLAHAAATADGLGMRVARVRGVESEAALNYSGLLELCRPLLSWLDTLPEPQGRTLRVALALEPGKTPDRYCVGAATLGLLAAVAESEALLVVVDDVQWLDAVSADALIFAARRLLADRVALLAAAREDDFDAHGVPELRVTGVDAGAAARIVEEAAGRPLPAEVVAALHAAADGNPLALVELPNRLTSAQLDGTEPLTGPLPVTEAIERAFLGRLQALPETTRRALCVLAAAGTDELAGPVAALALFGLDAGALDPAENEGLLELAGGRFAFRHPLLRAVAFHDRPAGERRAAHGALAAVLAGPEQLERRAWHLAAAAVGHDDEAADALDAAAERAAARGGQGAAAAALERAARLTAEPAVRLRRLVAAAQAAWDAGAQGRAVALVDDASAAAPDDEQRARLLGLSGRIELHGGSFDRGRTLLLESATTLAAAGHRGEAVTLLGLAGLTLHNLARVDEAIEVARRAVELAAGEPEEVQARADYHLGRALQIAGRTAEAEPLLERAVAHLLEPAEPSRFALQRAAVGLAVLDRAFEAAPLAARAVEAARATGPLQVVYALVVASQIELRRGEWRAAQRLAEEGSALAGDLGQDNVAATFAAFVARLAASRGDETAFARHEVAARSTTAESGGTFETLQLEHARGLLQLARDRLEDAAVSLAATSERVAALRILDRDLAPEPDLVETLVRLGRTDDARVWLDGWVGRGAAEAGRWGAALASRCAALVAADDAVDDAFATALGLDGELGDPFCEARTRLAYGERLRRSRRRVDARRELTAALETFVRLDAEAWVERARRELRASGATLRRAAEARDKLTPQELQVALQVAEGKTNREAGAALFLSPKTIEFHLARVYRKLDVSSRAELIRRFAAGEPMVAA